LGEINLKLGKVQLLNKKEDEAKENLKLAVERLLGDNAK